MVRMSIFRTHIKQKTEQVQASVHRQCDGTIAHSLLGDCFVTAKLSALAPSIDGGDGLHRVEVFMQNVHNQTHLSKKVYNRTDSSALVLLHLRVNNGVDVRDDE